METVITSLTQVDKVQEGQLENLLKGVESSQIFPNNLFGSNFEHDDLQKRTEKG